MGVATGLGKVTAKVSVQIYRPSCCISKRIPPHTLFRLLFLAVIPFFAFVAWSATGGSISGTLRDQTGSVVPDTVVTALNLDTTVQQTTKTNGDGFFAFTALPVGRYEIEIIREGFKPYKRTGLVIDVDTKLQVDVGLQMGEQTEEVTVSESSVHVETASTELGEVVVGTQMVAVALNGRSFTDLLALQPGIVPMTTQQPDSIVMAGVTVAIAPSGGLNPGNQSISGQREDANGFMVNGGDVKELMNGGTSIVPNLDSIAEFRVLTNNFDAEYGNYSGGIVNVVTKSGTNQLHGSGFEFLRNTALDARNFFSPERSFYRQNQFGGTVGGPILKNKLFFFGDYQGTRTVQGIDTGNIDVPSLSNRTGNFSDQPLTGSVSGPYLANLLSQKLGYAVSANEPYSSGALSQCVFRESDHSRSERGRNRPSTCCSTFPKPNVGDSTFATGSQAKIVRDDKTSFRVDDNTQHWGQLSGYYYFDDYNLNNPYPAGQGGATVPGFNALTFGRAQLLNLGHTKTFGASMVNELRLEFHAQRQQRGPARRRRWSEPGFARLCDRPGIDGHQSAGAADRGH